MKGSVEQALADHIKVMRTAIRLKHAIAADNEWNAKRDGVTRDFMKQVQKGKLPKALSPDAAMEAVYEDAEIVDA
jgi:HD superfamily phosphohydrolase YqeK